MRTTTHGTAGSRAMPSGRVLVRRAGAGIAGGLVGGLAFGIMMQLAGMMTMVAALVGSTAPAVGWTVHLLISVFFGAAFGVLLGAKVTGPVSGVLLGVGYGAVLWVVGALILMPARLSMPLFAINDMTINSLVGHLVFGLLLGAVVSLVLRSRA